MRLKRLLLENKLVKQHTPKYNIDLKTLKLSLTSHLQENPTRGFLPAAKCHANSNRSDHTLKASYGRTSSA